MDAEIQRYKAREYKRRYYKTHKPQMAAYRKKYMSAHPEISNAQWRRYYAKNAKKVNAYYRARRDRLRCKTPFGVFLKSNNIPQWYAAEKLGVCSSTVSNWAIGITKAKEDKIRAVWPEYNG